MSREALALWLDAVKGLTLVRTSLAAPVHVLMAEAVDLARFCRDYWQPVFDGQLARPGLSEAGNSLPKHIAEDLLELGEALHTAHTEYLLTIPPIHAGMRARAESVLSEIAAAIEWILDDDGDDALDDELSWLREEHAPLSRSVNSLAVQLADYAGLASKLRSRLVGVVGFDMFFIDDAHHLARELRQICDGVSLSVETVRALDLRNRVATLLVDRMNLVRSVAAVVFCQDPSIVRLTASTFELRQKTAPRRKLCILNPTTQSPTTG
jgi:hypothetical protein